MSYKTTAKHFELFKTECRKWQSEFGLMSYEVSFEKVTDLEVRATCIANPVNQMVTIGVGARWETKQTNMGIKKSAFHEMLELFLWDIREMLGDIYNDDIVNRKIHQIIRTLENVFFKP